MPDNNLPPEPGPVEPPSADDAAPEKPDDVDDLFKDNDNKGDDNMEAPADDETPAEEKPEKTDDVDDLFKETSNDSTANDVAADDMPADDATENSSSDAASDDADTDSLFSEPADDSSKSAEAADSLDDQTKTSDDSAASDEPAAVNELPVPATPVAAKVAEPADAMRTWTDNTGNYQVRARLVQVNESSVRLLKDTGSYTTVPNRRLSPADLEFVSRHSSQGDVAGNY